MSEKDTVRQPIVSVRNVVDRINKGKLKARRDGKRWLAHSPLAPPSEEDSGSQTAAERHLSVTVELLHMQLEEKDKQIER